MNGHVAIHQDNTNSLIRVVDEDNPNMLHKIEGPAVETGMQKIKAAKHLRYTGKITGLNRRFEALHRIKAYKVQSDMKRDINGILEIDFDWEDSGIEKPLHRSLYLACEIIESLIDEVFSDEKLASQWISPLHIYSNEAAYICITWKCESRTLIFQIRHDVMKYRQAEVNTDVSPKKIINKTGDLNTENSLKIWKWIINGE